MQRRDEALRRMAERKNQCSAWPREPSLPTAMESQLPEPTAPALLALSAPLSWSKSSLLRSCRPLLPPGFSPGQHSFWHSLDVQDAIRAAAPELAQRDRKVRRHSVACK